MRRSRSKPRGRSISEHSSKSYALRLYRDAGFSDAQTEIENVVLTAADVDHEALNQRFRNEIEAPATVSRTRNFHNVSLDTTELCDGLFLRFTGFGPPKTRELYLLKTPQGASYHVLTRGR